MYDYIIVGAGSAGCVLAGRLTEDLETSVLLIEAGGSDDLSAIHNPLEFPSLLGSAVDWAYVTEPEPQLHYRSIAWPRGKVLGGSSSINYLLYMRGNRYDYDHWHALGNAGWSYADVLPYFQKAEDQERGASEYRGVGGPLHITDQPGGNRSHMFIQAGYELGWPITDDFQGASQEGVGTLQMTIRAGRRESTAVSYLRPALLRSNLTVLTNALVTRVLFEGKRAIGVAYHKDGCEHQERVNKEVLLSGGAVNSPQLLLLSGVGPTEQLRTHDISVITDLPGVGQNLQDHPAVIMTYSIGHPLTQFQSESGAGAFVKTQPDLPEPDLEYLFNSGPTPDRYQLFAVLVCPQSKGYLTLRSSDPTEYPAIFANYLTEEDDLRKMVTSVRLARELNQTEAFARLKSVEISPGPQVQSEQEIVEYLRANVATACHPVGTCKMGHDELAVVDEKLRVHGMDGLRVIDASIMPTIVNANTNAPVIMIAEKLADMLTSPRV